MRSRFPIRLFLKMFWRTPDLIVPLTRKQLRKHRGVDYDYKRADGFSCEPPHQISIRITNSCNHRCAICGQHGVKGYASNHQQQDLFRILLFEEYKKIIDEMQEHKPAYYVTGGEPFLHPDLIKTVNYAKQKGSQISVVTNGYKVKESAKEIVKNEWDMILISLDGPQEVHDKCRGLPGAYKIAVEGILELKQWKKKLGSKKPYILTSTTLSRNNVGHLHKTFETSKELKPDMMVVYLSWFTSEQLGLAQAKILKDELGVEAFTWKSYVNKFDSSEAELFQRAVEQIKNQNHWPFEYLIIPALKGKQFREYYLQPEKTFGFRKCIAPFFMIDIMPNGDVVTCRDYIDVKAGNITENKLLDIWNNPKFVSFRKLLIKHDGLLPQCTRCCGLMGF